MNKRNALFNNIKLSAANVNCCYFNARAVPWAFPLELKVQFAN